MCLMVVRGDSDNINSQQRASWPWSPVRREHVWQRCLEGSASPWLVTADVTKRDGRFRIHTWNCGASSRSYKRPDSGRTL